MDLGLRGKVAVVTGGGSGIGKATGLLLAREGAAVCVADLHRDRAENVAAEIQSQGGDAVGIAADVSHHAEVERMMAGVVQRWKRIDVMINNAGIILQAPTVDMTERQWDKILTNNLKSCFLCSQVAAKEMIRQGQGGRIVNISSIHAELSEPSAGAYTAAKGGMEAFSRTLATELAPHKITVNCIRPGATYTELTVPMYTEPVKRALFTRIPLREIAEASWIADGVVFLASDRARYITGQTLAIDGGYLMDGSLPGAEYWK
ncbi:MAG TPA: SDR family NAD(P)-dependent oxidoreductase [Terriglobia bacterium]|nr:SDR family NAD(P)-dependent oxidoreductase [Terriglobia bacterium]